MTLKDLRDLTRQAAWRELASTLLSGAVVAPELAASFSTYWIEGGHHVREQVGDDHQLVLLLRKLLPPYAGAPVELFRGENAERWSLGLTGLAWTPDREVAEMFGRGLNAVRGGGVLLRGVFDAGAIICGPSAHSRYLGEGQFTVDPFVPVALAVLERYPSCE